MSNHQGRWHCVLFCAFVAIGALSAAEEKAPIKLGATLALSGKLAYMGQRELEGMQLAVEELNQAGGIGGRPLVLLAEDNQGEAKVAVAGVSKLLAIDKVDILFSAFTHITQAIREIVQKSGKVMIYESALRTVAEEHPLFFRDYYDARDSGEAIAIGIKRHGFEKVSFIAEINDSCIEFERGFRTQAVKLKINVVRQETYNAGETDFRPLLLRLKSSAPEALVTCTWRDTPLLMKNLKDLGMLTIPSYQFVGHNPPEADTTEMRRLYEENKTVSSWYGFIEGAPNPSQSVFIKKFGERFGHPPRPDSAFTYDDVKVLALALAPCITINTVDQTCLARHLLATNHPGIAGFLRFDKQRVSSRPVYLLQVRNGRWVEAN
jgi:branched-chain amino acid transport system substrate-binding protein